MNYYKYLMHYNGLFKILYFSTFMNIFAANNNGSAVDDNPEEYEDEKLWEIVKDIHEPLTSIFSILSLIDNLCVHSTKTFHEGIDYLYLGKCAKLTKFELISTGITKLQPYILSFKCIEHLNLYDNKLKSSCFRIITQLITLRTLDIRNNLIEKIPDSISKLVNLKELFFGGQPFNYVTDELYELKLNKVTFEDLNIVSTENKNKNTKKLIVYKLINLFSKIYTGENLELSYCDLPGFGINGKKKEKYYIKKLTLFFCNILMLPDSILRLNKLRYLDLRYNKITEVPKILSKLESLKELRLTGNEIRSYEKIVFHSLNTLHMDYGDKSEGMIDIKNTSPESLEHLHIYIKRHVHDKIEFAQDTISRLKGLYQSGLCNSEIPRYIDILEGLEVLNIKGRIYDETISSISRLKNLKRLSLNLYVYEDLSFLQVLFSAIKDLKNLEYLFLEEMDRYTLLDDKIYDLRNIKKLSIVWFYVKYVTCFSKLKHLESICFEHTEFCESKKQVNLFLKQNKIKVTYKGCKFNFTRDVKKEKEVIKEMTKRERRKKMIMMRNGYGILGM